MLAAMTNDNDMTMMLSFTHFWTWNSYHCMAPYMCHTVVDLAKWGVLKTVYWHIFRYEHLILVRHWHSFNSPSCCLLPDYRSLYHPASIYCWFKIAFWRNSWQCYHCVGSFQWDWSSIVLTRQRHSRHSTQNWGTWCIGTGSHIWCFDLGSGGSVIADKSADHHYQKSVGTGFHRHRPVWWVWHCSATWLSDHCNWKWVQRIDTEQKKKKLARCMICLQV